MKKVAVAAALRFSLPAVALVLVVAGCLDQGGPESSTYKGPLFRYHFAGRAHLPPGTNAAVYKAIDALPVTAELRAEVARKLAAAALPFWKKDLAAGAADATLLLKPLFQDLQEAEAWVEVRGPVGRTESVVAVELAEDHAQVWSANLRELTTAWKLGTPREVTLEGVRGWEAKRTQAPNTLQFFKSGHWVIVGLGQDRIGELSKLLRETKANGRALAALHEDFLQLSVDFPNLRTWFPALARFPLPAAVASVSPRADNVRTEIRLHYSSRIPWRPEAWKIPTEAISEPVTSFTVGQGIGPLLSALKGKGQVGVDPLPNQFCAWGIQHSQCRMFFAFPTAGDSYAAMKKVALELPEYILTSLTNARGEFYFVSNRSELVWTDLQFVVPVVHADKRGSDNLLVGGIFPLAEKRVPPPDALFAQVRGRTDLVYYDWEITQQRATSGKQFYQLLCLNMGRRLPSTNSVGQRWLSAVTPKLGNSVTEITRAGPQELNFVRKSHLGLTGFEIATVAMWLDSPGFPFSLELPPFLPWTETNSTAYRMRHPSQDTFTPLAPKGAAPKPGAPPGPQRVP